jgi:hypothetical protein
MALAADHPKTRADLLAEIVIEAPGFASVVFDEMVTGSSHRNDPIRRVSLLTGYEQTPWNR